MIQEFTQEIKNLILDTIRDLHTVIPGKIESFNPDKCEASVLPYGKFKKPDGSMIDYPKLSGVPVYIMQSSSQTATIVYPVKKDDECLVLFSEQALDTWRTGMASDIDLRFDLSNAVAIVGMFSKPNSLMKAAVAQDAVIIDRNGTRITLLPDNKVEIIGDTTIYGKLTVTGNLTAQSNLDVSGTGTIGGKVMNTHTHTSSVSGSQTSGPN